MFERYTEASRQAIFFARYEASQTGSVLIETEHLLLGLLRTDQSLTQRLLKPPDDIISIRKQLYQHLPNRKKISTSVDLPLSQECKRILAYGAEEAERRNSKYIEPQHLLLGLLREEKCLGAKALLERGVLTSLLENPSVMTAQKTARAPDDLRDLTAEAVSGSLGPLIGREHELERVIQILSRRTKNNAALVGESGVGKNTIVQGLAQHIANGGAPPLLADRTIVVLDAAALIGWKQDDRLLNFARRGNAILYVHGLFDLAEKRSAWGVMETIHAFELFLVSEGRQCIATGTPLGLRMTWERAPSLARLFEVVSVLPPNEDQAIKMVSGAKQHYEKFHGVVFADESIPAAVALSRWFLRNRNLPDRAFDLIDEAGARVALRSHREPREAPKDRKKQKPATDASNYNVVTAEDIVETVAERSGVSVTAVQSLLQTNEVEQAEQILKQLMPHISGGGREWVGGLAAYLAGCSAEDVERLIKAIHAARPKS